METFISAHSGAAFPVSDRITVPNLGDIARSEMNDADVHQCTDTNDYWLRSNMFEVEGSRLVALNRAHHYFECAHCNDQRLRVGRVRLSNGDYICREAWLDSGDYFTCDDCGEHFHNDAAHPDFDGLCRRCGDHRAEEDEEENSGPIREYCDKSFPPAKGKGALKFGVELEVEVGRRGERSELAERTLRALGSDFVILKDDGSLDNGFEIVSCPATPEIHYKSWDPLFTNRKGLLSGDTSTCGMHVHVSRAALSCLQLGKLLVFVNAPEHLTFIEKVAHRGINQWAAAVPKKLTDVCKPDSQRYRAINTCPSHTVEFRIFKGTLNRERFLHNLEFVHALVVFCAPGDRSIAECASLPAYLKFVEANRKRWPNHYARLVGDGYLKARPVKPQGNQPKPATAQAVPCVSEKQQMTLGAIVGTEELVNIS